MLETLLALAFTYRFVLVLVVAAIVFAILEWETTKKLVNEHMFHARELAQRAVLESGQEQEDWVVDHVWLLLPLPAKTFLIPFGGEDALRKVVKFLYAKAKDLLDNGVIDGSFQDKQ